MRKSEQTNKQSLLKQERKSKQIQDGRQLLFVGGAQVPDAGQEQADVGLGLEPQLGEVDDNLYVNL